VYNAYSKKTLKIRIFWKQNLFPSSTEEMAAKPAMLGLLKGANLKH
jgi:hypothetical protein